MMSEQGFDAAPQTEAGCLHKDGSTTLPRSEREGHTSTDVVVPALATLGAPIFRAIDGFPVREERNGVCDRVFKLKLTAPVGA